ADLMSGVPFLRLAVASSARSDPAQSMAAAATARTMRSLGSMAIPLLEETTDARNQSTGWGVPIIASAAWVASINTECPLPSHSPRPRFGGEGRLDTHFRCRDFSHS